MVVKAAAVRVIIMVVPEDMVMSMAVQLLKELQGAAQAVEDGRQLGTLNGQVDTVILEEVVAALVVMDIIQVMFKVVAMVVLPMVATAAVLLALTAAVVVVLRHSMLAMEEVELV